MPSLIIVLGLIPEALRLLRGVIVEIKAGRAESAANLAREAAERQALYARGRARLDKP